MSNAEFLEFLKEEGLLEYGTIMQVSLVQEALGLEIHETMNVREYDALKMKEMAAIDYVRSHLLDDGKTLAKKGGVYIIPMPSQNREYTERYIMSADKKLRRAIKLSMNTPQGDYTSIDDSLARAVRKRQALADVRRKGDFLK